eukprot:365178-Chlamydomonas_euryale.AAC.3
MQPVHGHFTDPSLCSSTHHPLHCIIHCIGNPTGTHMHIIHHAYHSSCISLIMHITHPQPKGADAEAVYTDNGLTAAAAAAPAAAAIAAPDAAPASWPRVPCPSRTS